MIATGVTDIPATNAYGKPTHSCHRNRHFLNLRNASANVTSVHPSCTNELQKPSCSPANTIASSPATAPAHQTQVYRGLPPKPLRRDNHTNTWLQHHTRFRCTTAKPAKRNVCKYLPWVSYGYHGQNHRVSHLCIIIPICRTTCPSMAKPGHSRRRQPYCLFRAPMGRFRPLAQKAMPCRRRESSTAPSLGNALHFNVELILISTGFRSPGV